LNGAASSLESARSVSEELLRIAPAGKTNVTSLGGIESSPPAPTSAMKFGYDFSSLSVLLVAALCVGILALFATMLLLASYARVRAGRRFGEPALVQKLETFDARAGVPSRT
jgi:hypothetical protein